MKIIKILTICALFVYLNASYANAVAKGKALYQAACQNCHRPQVAASMEAPAAFDVKQWDRRFEMASKEVKQHPDRFQSVKQYLLYQVTIGKGLMHHGGLCKETGGIQMDCSKDALWDAIMYMRQAKPGAVNRPTS